MKITLIVLGILAFQLALGIFVGKMIRAGSRLPARRHPDLESHGLHVVASHRSRAGQVSVAELGLLQSAILSSGDHLESGHRHSHTMNTPTLR